jgi:hypothetical protein
LISVTEKKGTQNNYQKLDAMVSEILLSSQKSWIGHGSKAVYVVLALRMLTSQYPDYWAKLYCDTTAMFIKIAHPMTRNPRVFGGGAIRPLELLEFLEIHHTNACGITNSQEQQWGPRLKIYTTAEKPDYNLLLAAAIAELAFPRSSIHRMVPGDEKTIQLINSGEDDDSDNDVPKVDLSFGLTEHNVERRHFGRKTTIKRESGGPSMTAASLMWQTYGKTIMERLSIQGSEAALAQVLKQVDNRLFIPLDQTESGILGWLRARGTEAFGWRTAIEKLAGGNTDQDYRLLVEWVKPILVKILKDETSNVLKSLTTEHLTWTDAQQVLGSDKLPNYLNELAEGAVQLMGVTLYPRQLVQKIQQQLEHNQRAQLQKGDRIAYLQKGEIDRIAREVAEDVIERLRCIGTSHSEENIKTQVKQSLGIYTSDNTASESCEKSQTPPENKDNTGRFTLAARKALGKAHG